ncbi:PspC domain-containing protein [Corynebacterium crudilactis]|nr:PspC domain-containing protein [Corynebacterium crudilactis]
MDKTKLYRSVDNSNIVGVCAGVAKYYDLKKEQK